MPVRHGRLQSPPSLHHGRSDGRAQPFVCVPTRLKHHDDRSRPGHACNISPARSGDYRHCREWPARQWTLVDKMRDRHRSSAGLERRARVRSVLNYLSANERLPTVFMPVSPAPYLNGGPHQFLSWVIKSESSNFSASDAAKWLEGRLPQPVEDQSQWSDSEE